MLQDAFVQVYSKFKLHFYQKVFERWQDKGATLTTVETFCMEIIYSMKNPTLNEFASIANISSPNAAYKVNRLIRKGYLEKVQSKKDKREYYLRVTDKYLEYYNISYQYMSTVMHRIEERFNEEELKLLEHVLEVMHSELMPEIELRNQPEELI